MGARTVRLLLRLLAVATLLLSRTTLSQAPAARPVPVAPGTDAVIERQAWAEFAGPDSGVKNGPLVKAGLDLTRLYVGHREYLRQRGPLSRAPFVTGNPLLRVYGDAVVIDAVASTDAVRLRSALVSLGLKNPAVHGRYVSGLLPIASIDAAARLPGLRLMRPAYAWTSTGTVTSQGDIAIAANLARSSLGVTGTGVTVGTLSDSYDCLGGAGSDISNDELPGGVTVLADEPGCGSGTDEGRAMMQIVHDLAPGAAQAFHTAFGGTADFANGITELATLAGANVIVDDVIYFAEPMFQDGPIAQAVDSVKQMGVAYFSSAGNSARKSYEAPYRFSGQPGLNGDGIRHDFDPGAGIDDLQQATIPAGATVTFVLQWDQPFASVSGTGSVSDMDIVLYSQSGAFLGGGTDNNIGGDPVEVFSYTNPSGSQPETVQIGLELFSGPAPGVIKFVYFGNMSIDEYATSSSTVYGHANAAGAMAVGAARYSHTPAYGVNPAILESFSSSGGITVLFDTSGASISEQRQKPEIVAPDGGDNSFFGSDYEPNGFPNFFGTSAAAPHAAGVAALLLEYNPGLTPDDIRNALQTTALDMDVAGVDFNTGYGLVQADQALASVVPLDTDGDGVPDYQDNCIDTPNGPLIPDAEGGASQQDDDGDGIGNACDLLVAPIVLPDANWNQVYPPQTLTPLRGQGPYTWSIVSGSLPPGLTLDASGVISGTPTAIGTRTFTVQVTDSTLDTATRVLSITVKVAGYVCGLCHE